MNKLSYFEMNKNKLQIYDKDAHEKIKALENFNENVITTENISQQSVMYATNSGESNHATTSDSATNANHATTSDSAVSATNANHSLTSDKATNADTATIASSANSVEWDNIQNKPNIPILKREIKTLNFTLNGGVRQEFNVPVNLSGTLLAITTSIDNNPSWFKVELKNLSMETLVISISNEYTETLTSNCNILILYV